MSKIISYEDACQLERNFHDFDIKNMPIFKEADESGLCEILIDNGTVPLSLDIFIKDDSLGKNALGFIISFHTNDLEIWVANEYSGELRTGVNVCTLKLDSSLNFCINKAKEEINKCPECGKIVPYKEQSGFSFAGRCCKDCLPAMKEKHEYPGWYN